MTRQIMRLVKIIPAILFAFVVYISQSNAQPVYKLKPERVNNKEGVFEKRVLLGYNIGVTSPLSLPNTIRRVYAWWPTFNPSLGYEMIWRPEHEWGLGAALKLEYKGMGTRDEVQYFRTILNVTDGSQEGEFAGDFSGKNKTVVHNLYASLPVYVLYRINARSRVKLGLYAAFMLSGSFKGKVYDGYIRKGNSLGEKVSLNEASFDFGKEQHRFDYGLTAGYSYRVRDRLSFNGDIYWGLAPLFPSSFTGVSVKMYNLFLGLGVGYKLNGKR